MRNLLLLCLIIISYSIGSSQESQRTIKSIDLSEVENSKTIYGALPYHDLLPFFSYFVVSEQGEVNVKMRFSTDNMTWTDWKNLERETHNMEKYITQLYYGDANYQYYEINIEQQSKTVSNIDLHFFSPSDQRINPTSDAATSDPAAALFACPCPMPEFQDRNDWCSSTTCPEHPSPSYTAVTHLIVHHSAGSNNSTNWAATVRAIWDYHVNGNGWSDIGYNWLIDPNGVLYQGRGDNIQGAHFCGHNSKTMGVCMMGTFTNVTPTTAAIQTLEGLLAWKSCDRDIDPLASSYHPSSGLTIHNISGHRDGCATECPGDSFYPMLSGIRQDVVDYIDSNCTALRTNQLTIGNELLSIVPNPVKNLLSLRFESELMGAMQWQLLNVHQQVILEWTSSKNTTLFTDEVDVDRLPKGVYFLQLQISGQKGVWKFVKS